MVKEEKEEKVATMKVVETIWVEETKVVTKVETRAETHLVDEV